ncbi:MAG: methyltransferase [Clostridia bacterium]|nr:methyltransferase [Clostridia bacterium]
MTNLTLEKFENGIEFYQDEDLYKFTSDSIKLAKFSKIKSTDHVLDMCAGNGVVGIYAYSINPFNKLYLNDIQSAMCDLIDKNIKLNKLENSCKTLCKDLNELKLLDFDKRLDVIVCNPPYFKLNGKIKQDFNKAICRHEITTTLSQIIKKASELIKTKGRFYLVVPATRLCECVVELSKNRFEPKRIEMYHSNGECGICLVESVKDAGVGVQIKINSEN